MQNQESAPSIVNEVSAAEDVVWQNALDILADQIPEITEKRQAIDQASREIVNTFGINSEFFNDTGRTTVFAAISERWANLNEAEDESEAEKMFLHDSIALLASNYSSVLGGARLVMEDEGHHSPLSEKGQLEVFDRYTDITLTKAVADKISSGELLTEVRERLGITLENEEDYEVRVLSIATTEGDSIGLDIPIAPQWDEMEGTGSERSAQLESWVDLDVAVKRQRSGLVERSVKMASELGRDDLFAPAWATELDGRKLLCISMPLAEKLTDPDLTNDSRFYTDEDLRRNMAIIEHEYIHTQGGLNVDREPYFGINLEELRAEYFSGNKQGYVEIKGFFKDYETITGESLTQEFEGKFRGGSVAEVYSAIARRVGLSGMLEVIMGVPDNYLRDQSNEYSRRASEYLGGLDGILSNLIRAEILHDRGQELEDRVTEKAKRLAEYIKPGSEWLWGRNKTLGLNVVTDMVMEKAEQLGLKEKE